MPPICEEYTFFYHNPSFLSTFLMIWFLSIEPFSCYYLKVSVAISNIFTEEVYDIGRVSIGRRCKGLPVKKTIWG